MTFLAATLKRPPATPCIGVCELAGNGFCVGCARTGEEISRWSSMSEAERWRLIYEVLPLRKPVREGMDSAALFLRLRRALHALSAPPTGPGLNHAELADLLPAQSQLVPAAVLVGLIDYGDRQTILLTRRTDHLAHHAGQISFPGGRMETSDTGPVNAALREVLEEVGVGAEWIEPIGFLDPFETISNYRVLPLVARLRPGFTLALQHNEVAEAFELPLTHFLDPARAGRRDIEYRGRLRSIHEFDCDGRRVWGATATMLINLRDRLEACVDV